MVYKREETYNKTPRLNINFSIKTSSSKDIIL